MVQSMNKVFINWSNFVY